MALTVRDLYKNSIQYRMRLLAGEEGLNQLVQWVHIIETNEGAQFLRGQELVITEGVREHEEERLLTLIQTIHSRGASAMVINTGMFIQEVPESAVRFCNEKGFPLFSIPWEVPLVDVTRNFCQRIMDSAVREDSAATIFKNYIFDVGDKATLKHQLERFGYRTDSPMLILCLFLDLEQGTEEFVSRLRRLKLLAEGAARSAGRQYISFGYQEKRILVLLDGAEDEEDFLARLSREISAAGLLEQTYIGAGESRKGLENQAENFRRACSACEIARRRHAHLLRYQDLDLYKLLVHVGSSEVLADFWQDTLGRLAAYDRDNGTDYHGFLRAYIECGGHPAEVSRRLFIHRNTVNNYVRKAGEILGVDLLSLEGRAKLYVAYCAEDLL